MSSLVEKYVEKLVEKTEIEVTNNEVTVKCPSCNEIIKFTIENSKDGVAFGLTLNNHLYYCLLLKIPNPLLRNKIAHEWSVAIALKVRDKFKTAKAQSP